MTSIQQQPTMTRPLPQCRPHVPTNGGGNGAAAVPNGGGTMSSFASCSSLVSVSTSSFNNLAGMEEHPPAEKTFLLEDFESTFEHGDVDDDDDDDERAVTADIFRDGGTTKGSSSSSLSSSADLKHEIDVDTSIAKGGVSTPFPWKLHIMLEAVHDEGRDLDVVSWLSHGKAFIVHKPKDFVHEIMPKFFNQSKYASFQRQLNLYGFQRLLTGSDKGAYYHSCFVRGQPRLCKGMIRQKVKGTKVRRQAAPDEEPNFDNGNNAAPATSSQVTGSNKRTKGTTSGKSRKGSSLGASVSAASTALSKIKTRSFPSGGGKTKKKVKTMAMVKAALPIPVSGKTVSQESPTLISLMRNAHLPLPASVPSSSTHSPSTTRRTISNESFRPATLNDGGSAQAGASFLPPRTVSPQQRHQSLYASFLHAASTHGPPVTAKGGDQLFFEGLPFRYMEHWDLTPTLIAPRTSSLRDSVATAIATATATTTAAPVQNLMTVPTTAAANL